MKQGVLKQRPAGVRRCFENVLPGPQALRRAGRDATFCGLCALVIVGRAARIPGVTLKSALLCVVDWIHADYGPVAGAAFDLLAFGEPGR